MQLKRALTALSVATLATLGLAACGDDGAPSAEGTAPSGSASASAPVEPDSSASGLTTDDFVARLAAAQEQAGPYSMSMEDSTSAMAMQADIVPTDSAVPDMAMTMTVAELGDIEVRVVDESFYMKFGELTGGKFVSIDQQDPDNPLAAQLDQLTEQSDVGGVGDLEDAVTSVEAVGEPEEFDGVPTQRYDVVVDTAKVTGSLAAQAENGVELPAELTYSYWVGEDDLPRRMTMDDPTTGLTLEILFTNWGADLTVEVPSADEISTEPLF